MTIPTARKSWKSALYSCCGRCGRYFATLIEDVMPLTTASLPTRALQAAFNVVIAEEEVPKPRRAPARCYEPSKRAPRRVSIRVDIKTGGAPRRGGVEHDRAAGSMPAMQPQEPAGESFLRVVRRPAEERRAACHAPGAQPCPGRSRLALQARPCWQGAGGGRGGPGCRGRTVLATTQDRHRRAVVVACRPRRRLRLTRLSRQPEPGRGLHPGMG